MNDMITKEEAQQTPGQQMVVMARTPEELEAGQKQLIVWANQKINHEENELHELEVNLEIARRNNWQTAPWKRRVALARKRVSYYEKIKAALEAGYYIVPNFPVDIFAIRTCRESPRKNHNASDYRWSAEHIRSQQTESPQLGQGKYVAPGTMIETWQEKEKDKEGNPKTIYHAEASEFLEPDFPVALVKPQVMEDTSRAMRLKFFDELGVLPQRRGRGGGDPIVVGRVILRRGGMSDRVMTFMISWWADFREF